MPTKKELQEENMKLHILLKNKWGECEILKQILEKHKETTERWFDVWQKEIEILKKENEELKKLVLDLQVCLLNGELPEDESPLWREIEILKKENEEFMK